MNRVRILAAAPLLLASALTPLAHADPGFCKVAKRELRQRRRLRSLMHDEASTYPICVVDQGV